MKKRYVISGGTCCGKSATIKALKDKGYRCVKEVAREVLARGHNNYGTSIEQIAANQEKIYYYQSIVEEGDKGGFFDRGTVDNIAYSQHFLGRTPTYVDIEDARGRYDKVFFLDRLPYDKDGLRVEEDEIEAEVIHNRIRDLYDELGYDIIDVPVMSLEDRVDFILNHIKEEN